MKKKFFDDNKMCYVALGLPTYIITIIDSVWADHTTGNATEIAPDHNRFDL